jgi:hypothetical protein
MANSPASDPGAANVVNVEKNATWPLVMVALREPLTPRVDEVLRQQQQKRGTGSKTTSRQRQTKRALNGVPLGRLTGTTGSTQLFVVVRRTEDTRAGTDRASGRQPKMNGSLANDRHRSTAVARFGSACLSGGTRPKRDGSSAQSAVEDRAQTHAVLELPLL